jgi:hypothetical protein
MKTKRVKRSASIFGNLSDLDRMLVGLDLRAAV